MGWSPDLQSGNQTGSIPVSSTNYKGVFMTIEALEERFMEFDFYKRLILAGKTDGRNVLVERKDGTCAVIHHRVKWNVIPGMKATIDEIERVTIFIDGKEFEFVACQ